MCSVLIKTLIEVKNGMQIADHIMKQGHLQSICDRVSVPQILNEVSTL